MPVKKSATAVKRRKKEVMEDVVRVVIPHVAFVGNGAVLRLLGEFVASGVVAHAYGFFGPVQVGKTRAAQEFAMMLLECDWGRLATHPDLVMMDAESDEVSVVVMREVVGKLSQSPLYAKRRVAVIANAELLSADAANTLLKTLEEPRGNAVMILTSSREDVLLPTVVSRLAVVRFGSVSEGEMSGMGLNREVMALAQGAPGRALRLQYEPELLVKMTRMTEWWERIATQSVAERFVVLDEFMSGTTVFGELQKMAGTLLDAGEYVCGRSSERNVAMVRVIIEARRLLAQNAQPRAVMEWVVTNVV
jgi:hypothetical protein